MTLPIVGAHNAVPPYPYAQIRLPTPSSAVCGCGAVYDRGNVVVPAEFLGLCGRCAFDRGLRPGDCTRPAFET
ncbi:MAG: hypothetical protein JO352_36215 [Chloroflexi bacterium]|nr:hypothetical protein [Chloroflexota bacterium]MBV9602294.1 hypothetical protein [Chloroflexota bacterium]